MENVKTAILGATGYTGAELIRLLDAHPHFEIRHLGANAQAGRRLREVVPAIHSALADNVLQAADAPLADDIELVFTALPHTAAAHAVVRALQQGKKVVDLSADFRHQSAQTYTQAYGIEHSHAEYLSQAVYGLSEWQREAIADAQLIANPGCYPTSVLLPLIPLLKLSLIDTSDSIIIDAKSGASGAGRGAKSHLLYCEVNEGLGAYGLPRHRHAWEMEEWAQQFSGIQELKVRFVPHLLPTSRGMLSTLHLRGKDAATWHEVLQQTYAEQPFVHILPEGQLPSTKAVNGSNCCIIGLSVLGQSRDGQDEVVIVSCIDNLLKGAAGQAVQNANIMFGWQEDLGLPIHAQWP